MTDLSIMLDLAGSAVRLTMPRGDFLKRLMPTIGPLMLDAAEAALRQPDYDIVCRRGMLAEPAPDAQLIAGSELPGEGLSIMTANDQAIWVVLPGQATLTIERGRRLAEIAILSGKERRIAGSCFMLALEDAIDRSGQFILHAACLELPDGRGSVLIHAPSGTGKTTTTLAMLGAGFGLCSDDATILRMTDGAIVAWGLPRDLKVHRNTAAMLPWVMPLLIGEWDEQDERALPRARLGDRFRLAGREPKPVAGVFSLARSPDGRSAVEPLSPVEAAVELTADNVRVGATGLLPIQARRFDGVLALLDSAPTFRLSVGSDLDAIAPAVLRALRSV